MTRIELTAILPRNRNFDGVLRVDVNGKLTRQMMVLARGSRGDGDTQFLNRGNTPTGTYDGSVFVRTHSLDPKAYGPYGFVRLEPLSGNALVAHELMGRRGLLIHSGTLGIAGPWKGKLRPTNGCLRVSDEDMKFLLDLLSTEMTRTILSADSTKVQRSEVFEVKVSVGE